MRDPSGDSVTRWLKALRDGEEKAAEQIWERYYLQLVNLAKRQINDSQTPVADEQDVVVSVFDTLFRGLKEGRFLQLQDRFDLWCLLIAITKQKAASLRRRENRKKRGGGIVRVESQMDGISSFSLDSLCGDEPTPDFLAALQEEHAAQMRTLRNDELRQIASWTLEGKLPQEIADELDVSTRTVQRKLLLIRKTWSQVL